MHRPFENQAKKYRVLHVRHYLEYVWPENNVLNALRKRYQRVSLLKKTLLHFQARAIQTVLDQTKIARYDNRLHSFAKRAFQPTYSKAIADCFHLVGFDATIYRLFLALLFESPQTAFLHLQPSLRHAVLQYFLEFQGD